MEEKLQKKEIIMNGMEIAAKTALSTIPIGGPLMSETWDAIKNNSIAKRYEDWQHKIEERISKLELSLEDIGNNGNFTTAMINATEQALKTDSERKREYLANAVLNSINIDLEENTIRIYLDMISRYTELHLIILFYYNNPKLFVTSEDYYSGSAKQPLWDALPKLKENEAIIDKVINDLYNDGVMSSKSDSLNAIMTNSGMVASRTTKLGKELVEFMTYKF